MSFDLSTHYGNLQLGSPIIVGSCPLAAEKLQQIAMITNGAAAIVLPSLPEEHLGGDAESSGELSSVNDYLNLIDNTKNRMTDPVIASFSGTRSADWASVARKMELAGADGIEFSVRQPKPDRTLDSATIEKSIVDCCAAIKQEISIPLFVKLTNSYTSIGHLAGRLQPTADGLTLFGRSPAMDIELDRLTQFSKWRLSERGSIVQSLESLVHVNTTVPELSIAASGGIRNCSDLIKALLTGADAVMITSAIYHDGASVIGSLLDGLTHFMEQHHIHSIDELKTLRPEFNAMQSSYSVDPLPIEGDFAAVAEKTRVPVVSDRWGHAKSAE